MEERTTMTDQEDDPETVKFEFYLMYNWKKPDTKPKIYTNEPSSKEGPYHIVEKVEREIVTPEKQQFKSEGKLEISQAKMKEMIVEEL